MKTYMFTREFYSTEPGWEIDLYKSGDINGTWTSFYAAMQAVLVSEGILEEDATEFLDEYSLEQICLENDIYVSVEDM